MMELASGVLVRRAQDRSRRRKPLRLQIRRRVARKGTGVERFVTQVLMGEHDAVLVPRSGEPVMADGLAVVEPVG
jgi:hypothetical protein